MDVCVGITGSSGFIGRHFVESLKQANQKYVEFEGDLLKKEDIEVFFKHKITHLVHLAGAAFGNDFEALLQANVVTTHNLLDQAVKNGIEKFILASSVAVYGPPQNGPSLETDALQPDSPYGLSKLLSEEVASYFGRTSPLSIIVLRFSPIYGAGNTKGVVNRFLTDSREKGEVTVHGNGTQRRNYLHVSGACQAILKSLDHPKGGVFNIAHPKDVSINDLLETLKERYELKINYLESQSTSDLLVSTKLAEEELGFQAQTVDFWAE